MLAIGFVLAGSLHFLRTPFYTQMMPPVLGHAQLLVYISGVFEILGGLGVLLPQTRRLAGFGLIALLLAVFPANVYMAMRPDLFAGVASPLGLAVRLPFQFLFVAWVWFCCL
ncbi:MAG: DoxX family protein [Candidatus Eremiobacteraeota bacterium]|nr:DoxX family protein [Candidatus Eremiobacteraeota bacterium]